MVKAYVSNFLEFGKQRYLYPARRRFAKIADAKTIPLQWCRGTNWGDALSPVLVSLLAEKPSVFRGRQFYERYLVIGSILEDANQHSSVWGSGFIAENRVVTCCPKVVHAVRGPLSREMLLRAGLDCPKVFGDPALLFPAFFHPTVPKRYRVGVIPHYIDKANPWVELQRATPGVCVIDIECGLYEFVNRVLECDVIVSSSLHGLICADAYGVPNLRMKLSNDIIGGDFKFFDYFLSVGRKIDSPILVRIDTSVDDLLSHAAKVSLDVDLALLAKACPFISEKSLDIVMSWCNSKPHGFQTKCSEIGD